MGFCDGIGQRGSLAGPWPTEHFGRAMEEIELERVRPALTRILPLPVRGRVVTARVVDPQKARHLFALYRR